MSNKARVRVEAKKLPSNANEQDHYRNFTQLLRVFKRKCDDYGIKQEMKEREYFVRPCDTRRRKRLQKILLAQEGPSDIQKTQEMESW